MRKWKTTEKLLPSVAAVALLALFLRQSAGVERLQLYARSLANYQRSTEVLLQGETRDFRTAGKTPRGTSSPANPTLQFTVPKSNTSAPISSKHDRVRTSMRTDAHHVPAPG